MDKEKLIQIKAISNGPLSVTGRVQVILPNESEEMKENSRLCRCGASNGKPYCDGTHVKVGFKG